MADTLDAAGAGQGRLRNAAVTHFIEAAAMQNLCENAYLLHPNIAVVEIHFQGGALLAAEDASTMQGGGFYKFNIGEYKATVVSDGYGELRFAL